MTDIVERLRTRLAIQFGMHSGGDLAKAAQAERDKAWTEHLIEREELKAEIERLKAERQKAERHTTKQMLEDILDRHGQHYGLGRGGLKGVK